MATAPAVISSSILADFQRVALAFDLDPAALLARAGIDRRHLQDPELTLPVTSVIELFEIAALSSGIEDFGLRVGEARGIPDIGPLILMLREEATVGDALRTLGALLHLHSGAIYIHLEDSRDPILTVDIITGGMQQCRQVLDSGVAGLIHVLRWLLGDAWSPASVCFTHSRPKTFALHQRFFRCPMEFLQDCNGIVLRRRDLDKKLPTSAPVLRKQVERYIQTMSLASSDTYVHTVTQIVAMALPKGEATSAAVAGYLGTYPRTLNRRLARAGLNYTTVVQNVRQHLAVQYLLGSGRPLSDIAGLLGFASLSTFTRWFSGTFKCAPSEWRRARGHCV